MLSLITMKSLELMRLMDNQCDVCEAPDGEPHCNCGNCDCGGLIDNNTQST